MKDVHGTLGNGPFKGVDMNEREAKDLAREFAPSAFIGIGLAIFAIVGLYSVYLRLFTGYTWMPFAIFAGSGAVAALMARRFSKGKGFGLRPNNAPIAGNSTGNAGENNAFDPGELSLMRVFFNEEYEALKTTGTVEVEPYKLEEHKMPVNKLAQMFTASLFNEGQFFEVEVKMVRSGLKMRVRGVHLIAPSLLEQLETRGDISM